MTTSKVDVSDGYAKFYGIQSIHDLAARGNFRQVSICLKKGADPNEKAFPEDDKYVRTYVESVYEYAK